MLSGTFFFMVSAETFANADSLQKVMDKYQEMAKSYNSPADIMNIANAIAKVYVDNYNRYLKDVFPQAQKAHLTSAINHHPSPVYYNQYLDYQLAMFSHEFGIFLMQDSIDPIVEEMKEYVRTLNSWRRI